MPPVLGPSSPSPTRLKSWAGGRARTVVPSVTQKTEASGPSRYSSTTTRPPGLARQAAAWVRASSRSFVTTTPLPAASPSSLTTCGEPRSSSASSTSSGVVQTWARAVGTLAAAMTSLANALLPSSCAAAADGPKTRNPRVAQDVGHAGDEGGFRADDDEVDGEAVRDGEDRVGVGDVGQRLATGDHVDARVAGGGHDGVDRVVRRERPGEGVLTGPGAEDEDYPAGHDDHPRANAAERQPAVHGTEPPGDVLEPGAARPLRPSGPKSGARCSRWSPGRRDPLEAPPGPKSGARCSREAGGTITREHRASRSAPLGGGPAASGQCRSQPTRPTMANKRGLVKRSTVGVESVAEFRQQLGACSGEWRAVQCRTYRK